MQLSPTQLAAVEAAEARVVVIAGAGSGKTRVLTERVGHLLVERAVLPERIVALTFTRAAAAELRSRVGELVSGEAAEAMYIGTFHGLAYQLLQRHPQWACRRPGWVLYETSDVEAAVERAARDAGAKVSYVRGSDPRRVDVAKTLGSERAARCYADILKRANAVDYDELERAVVHAAMEGHLDGLWDHVLVDESQDCSVAQWQFVVAVTCERGHLYCVGDPRQSIYRFRGAEPAAFVRLLGRDDWHTYHLATNYRSRPGIVEAANRIARAMGLGLPDCEAAREETTDPSVATLRAGVDVPGVSCAEPALVSAWVYVSLALSRPRDVAILARRWRDLDAVEQALADRGIPTRRLRRPADPFATPEGRVVLAALRLCVDPHDDLAAETLGAALGEDVAAARLRAATERRPLLECLPMVRDFTTGISAESAANGPVSAGTIARWAWKWTARQGAQEPDAVALVEEWTDERFDDDTVDVDPAAFLAHRAALSDVEPAGAGEEDAVTLSTVHGAKGLEWPVVYVVGAAESAWPTASAARNPDDLAEERRLFYVACTRARDHLVVTSPAIRVPYPGAAEEPCEPSRFVREMGA